MMSDDRRVVNHRHCRTALSLDFFLCHNMRQKKLYHSPSQPQLTRSDMSAKPESSRLAAGCVGRAPLPFEQVNVDERKLCARWRVHSKTGCVGRAPLPFEQVIVDERKLCARWRVHSKTSMDYICACDRCSWTIETVLLMACQVNVVHTLLLGLIGISLLCFSFYSVPLRLYIKEEVMINPSIKTHRKTSALEVLLDKKQLSISSMQADVVDYSDFVSKQEVIDYLKGSISSANDDTITFSTFGGYYKDTMMATKLLNSPIESRLMRLLRCSAVIHTSLQDVPEALNYSSSRDGHSVLLNIANNDTSLNLTEHHNSLKGVPTKALLSVKNLPDKLVKNITMIDVSEQGFLTSVVATSQSLHKVLTKSQEECVAPVSTQKTMFLPFIGYPKDQFMTLALTYVGYSVLI
uniref:Uncharacterized protein n=1 Tax=Timema cristinae TaxID=61476 RepID=A0A7R9GWM9_TIMCR|nr:unnamed protein product [Timema cristinae]